MKKWRTGVLAAAAAVLVLAMPLVRALLQWVDALLDS